MQRFEEGGVVISCDFCSTDWDEVLPMIEGHRGSFPAPGVICLECVKVALREVAIAPEDAPPTYACTLCRQQEISKAVPRWVGPAKVDPPAMVCRDCLRQAAGAFHKDKDVDWQWDELASRGKAKGK